MPLAEQDRSLWDTALIAEGVAILQAALARDRLGEYQAQAAIAALHADAPERRRPTGCRSWSGTTSSSPRRTARWSGSTVPWRSGRRTGRRPGSAALADVDPGLPVHGGVGLPARTSRVNSTKRADLYAAAAAARTSPSAITSCAGPRSSGSPSPGELAARRDQHRVAHPVQGRRAQPPLLPVQDDVDGPVRVELDQRAGRVTCAAGGPAPCPSRSRAGRRAR